MHPTPIGNSVASSARFASHRDIAAYLAAASDCELMEILASVPELARGHAVVHLAHVDAFVFIKLLHLSDIEQMEENLDSTKNLFSLPNYFQYRIGSCGFGASREIDTHRLANDWVLSGECAHFPLLHHTRILPLVGRGTADGNELDAEPWGACPEIQNRFAALANATCSAVLFLEHIPQTLGTWCREQLLQGPGGLDVITDLERTLMAQLAFLHGRGVLHMDAHFDNILTDGTALYWSDFGLSISRSFSLSAAEQRFFERHKNFDQCTVITSLVHAVVSQFDTRTDWREALRELTDGSIATAVPPAIRTYLKRKAPLVLAVGEFYAHLLSSPQDTDYPAERLSELLSAASPASPASAAPAASSSSVG